MSSKLINSKLIRYLTKKKNTDHPVSKESLYRKRLITSQVNFNIIIIAFTINTFCMILYYQKILKFGAINIFYTVFLSIVSIACYFLMPYHMKNYGLNLNRLKFNIVSGSIISIVGLGIVILIRIYLYSTGHMEYGFNIKFHINYVIYIYVAALQELITRGILQSYFIALFDDFINKKIYSILVSSLVFANFHVILGFQVFLLTFVLSVFLGFYYEKTRSIVGVSIVHAVIGSGFFFFSNIFFLEL